MSKATFDNSNDNSTDIIQRTQDYTQKERNILRFFYFCNFPTDYRFIHFIYLIPSNNFLGVSLAFDSALSFRQLWLIGPLFICSGIMVALKSLIYLRRKCLIHRLLRHTALLRELARQSRNNGASTSNNETDGSSSPHFDEQSSSQISSAVCALPPSYDSLPGTPLVTIEDPGGGSIVEAPPPSYDEAMQLISTGKIKCDESSKTEIMKQLSSRESQD